jgi:5'-nucleotidase
MRILLSNDDGYAAPGLTVLAQALRNIAEVVVVAPERNRSGASNSLTLDRPLRLNHVEADVYAVDGTPADCVNLALTGAVDARPDLVISGINAGENLGEDVLYSGTAAMEGALLGLPAIAISQLAHAEPVDYRHAVSLVLELVRGCARESLPRGTLLNVNVPQSSQLPRLQLTRLGRRHRDTVAIRQEDPRHRPVFWLGPIGSPGADAGPGTDFHAVSQGYASVTPIHTDLTAYSQLEGVGSWLATAAGSSV